MRLKAKRLPTDYDYPAPGEFEIRNLPTLNGGERGHCTLPPGGISLAVRHKSVEEIWYFLQG